MVEEMNVITDESSDDDLSAAIVFELENLAFDGRKIAYDVLRGLIADRDAELTPLMFAKNCLSLCPTDYISELLEQLGKKRVSSEKLAHEMNNGVNVSLEDSGVKVSDDLLSILKKAKNKGLPIGALTGLDEEVAARLCEKHGLSDFGITIFSAPVKEGEFPTADGWLKLAKAMETPRGGCTALVTSAVSSRAALSAGMRCVVFPDQYTGFQDFSGVDRVVDECSNSIADSIVKAALQTSA